MGDPARESRGPGPTSLWRPVARPVLDERQVKWIDVTAHAVQLRLWHDDRLAESAVDVDAERDPDGTEGGAAQSTVGAVPARDVGIHGDDVTHPPGRVLGCLQDDLVTSHIREALPRPHADPFIGSGFRGMRASAHTRPRRFDRELADTNRAMVERRCPVGGPVW